MADSDAVEMPGSDAGEKQEICRDFKNGDCRRGSRCKFTHPELPKLEACHDFQTRGCNRPNCKYAHLSKDALKLYEETGKLPSSNHNNNGMGTLQKALFSLDSLYGKRSRTDSLDLLTGLTPMAKRTFSPVAAASDVTDICRDFDREDCRRGARCRYFHPKLRICRDYQKNKCERESCRFLHMTREEENEYENSGKGPDHISKEDIKRNRIQNPEGARGYSTGRNLGTGGILGGIGNIHPGLDVRSLHTARGLASVESLIGLPKRNPELLVAQQKKEVMSKKIQELQQQVLDLRKMNDILYEQNKMYQQRY